MRWQVSERQKLIHFLQAQLRPAPSGKALRKALESNLCRVNGVVERFGSSEVGRGSVVELSAEWQDALAPKGPKGVEFAILHEDEHLLIVNKPAGWVCTDDACRQAFGAGRFLIHRLDKETTGALLIAKSAKMRDAMIALFREKTVHKLYYAIVDGTPTQERGVRRTHLAKVGTFEGQTRWGSSSRGMSAETHWKVLARGPEATLVTCQPVTGRTHQIRVHLAELGHPILVDRQYAERHRCKYFAKRPLLHAVRLQFVHPLSGVEVDVAAPVPEDMVEAMRALGLRL